MYKMYDATGTGNYIDWQKMELANYGTGGTGGTGRTGKIKGINLMQVYRYMVNYIKLYKII